MSQIDYEAYVKRAVVGLKSIGRFYYTENSEGPHELDCSLVGRVKRVFCCGLGTAYDLCRLAGEDPDYSECAERINSEKQ